MSFDLAAFADKLRRYCAQLQATPDDVATATGIAKERVLSLQKAEAEPTGDEVLILADYFRCDFKFFVSNEKLAPFEETETLFRRFGDRLSREDRWSIQELLFLCETEAYLMDRLSRMPRKAFEFTKRGTFVKGNATRAAQELRVHLGLGSGEVHADVFADLRAIGVHLFRRRLASSDISGLFIQHPTAGRCVLVNYDEDVFRQRFTAAHEGGHAILDIDQPFVVSFTKWSAGDLVEVGANTFAAQFLVPDDVLAGLKGVVWTSEKTVEIATRLRVNIDTLVFRLKDAGYVNEQQSSDLRHAKVPRAQKSDPELPDTLVPASRQRKEGLLKRGLSTFYVSLCFDAYDQGLITRAKLAESLLAHDTELSGLRALFHGGGHAG